MGANVARGQAAWHRRKWRVFGVALAVLVASGALLPAAPASASILRPLSVTLTFDDGAADQLVAQQLLKKYGMAGTFYINSGFIGLPGYMTRADLATLKANGHEIGGHTVTHPSLISLAPDEANRQICQDRNTLLSWGYAVTSLAYPFADSNPTVKAIAQQCGYNTARSVGDLRSPTDCLDCPAAETIPPADAYETRTPDDITTAWTLADLKNTVTRAERNGGWLAFNLHHVCDGCVVESIRPAVLEQFLAWLKPRSSLLIRTTVKTVRQVTGGLVRPAVAPAPVRAPGAPGVNTVVNPSLETAGATPNLPDCFNSAGYGTNTVTYARVADAHSGTSAAQVTVSGRTDGDAKLVPTLDLGHCSSSVAAGRAYEVSAWYKSTAQVFFTMYVRNAVGQWRYWTQSPRLAPAAGWTRAGWVTPVPPADAVAASFGLTIDSVGTVVTDDYGFADATGLAVPAPVGVNALRNASLETDGADGFPQCWTGTGFGSNTAVWTRVTDAADGTYAQRLDVTAWTDGDAKLIPSWDTNCAPLALVGHEYRLGVAYKSTAPTFYTLYRQDAAGVWSYWTQSPFFPASAGYAEVTWQSPAVPAGTRAVTFGLTLAGVGSVTTDKYSLIAN